MPAGFAYKLTFNSLKTDFTDGSVVFRIQKYILKKLFSVLIFGNFLSQLTFPEIRRRGDGWFCPCGHPHKYSYYYEHR
jgi:hypothetical protein